LYFEVTQAPNRNIDLIGDTEMTNMLSQDEIDALVMGGDSPKAQSKSATDSDGVRPYNAATQHRVVTENLHALEIINERFARGFRAAMFLLLRRTVDVSVVSVNYQSYSEFSQRMPAPTNLNIVAMKPLRGNGLIVFPAALIFWVVETLFGGEAKQMMKTEGRDFTPTEQLVISRLLNHAISSYQEAWKDLHPLEIGVVRSEMMPRFANITSSSNEVVVNTTFRLESQGVLDTNFNIAFPYLMVEPVHGKLSGPLTESNPEEERLWKELMSIELKETTVEIQAKLLKIDLTVEKFMNLKVGDILNTDFPDVVTAEVDGIPVMDCEFGTMDDQRVLLVKKLINYDNGNKPERMTRGLKR
jgi:flagellar motor switch protein FliM